MEKLDARFGELAVQRGLLSFDKLKEAIDIQNKLQELGLESKSIIDIVIEKRYLTRPQVESLLTEIGVRTPAPTSSPASSRGNEYELGELALKTGLVSFEQLREALEIQQKLRGMGYEPKRLEEILLEKGYLSAEQLKSLQSEPKVSKLVVPKRELKLGELAVRNQYITEQQLQECLDLQAKLDKPKKLGELLLERGYVNQEQLDHLLLLAAKASAPFQIPGYEIISKIGTGGMGAVYKAKQLSIDRLVAIKILFPKYAKDRDYVARFMHEAKALASMSHVNVVAAIDAGEVRGVPYYVMEYVEGVPVSTLLDEKGRLPEKECLTIGVQVARALSHAHKHKIVHRDVKPQNILLTKDNVAKLCDLGIAKRKDLPQELSITTPGIALGTPYYISPEAALGRDVDIRADIYSLGATLYHLATGTPPFDDDSPAAVLSMHVNAPLDAPKKRYLGISGAFNAMILKMMRKNPDERYQSPTDVVTEMEHTLKGMTTTHKPKTGRSAASAAPPPAEKTFRTTMTLILMGIVLAICAGLTYYFLFLRAPR